MAIEITYVQLDYLTQWPNKNAWPYTWNESVKI